MPDLLGDTCEMPRYMDNWPNTIGGQRCEETFSTGAGHAWYVHPVDLVIPQSHPRHQSWCWAHLIMWVGISYIFQRVNYNGNQYGVVFVVYLTKWPEVFATLDQTAITITRLFVEIISHHGVPAELLSDRDTASLKTDASRVWSHGSTQGEHNRLPSTN